MKKIPIFDGHNDSLTRLMKEGSSFFERSDLGHIDLPRLREGGVIGGFFAIQAPAEDPIERRDDFGFSIDETGYSIGYPQPVSYSFANQFTHDVLDQVHDMVGSGNRELVVVENQKNLENLSIGSLVGMLLHLEGAEAISESMEELEGFYEKGVRSLGPFWSRKNVFGMGVQYKFPSTPDIGSGLTNVGKQLIRECNNMGVVVDLAHINEKGFWDAVKITDKPVIVTHTNVHAICPSSRNLTDEQIDAIGESNGIIGINFEPITVNFRGLSKRHDTLDETFAELSKTPLSEIVRHISYIAERIGIDHVGFGADMDGAIMPSALRDASQYQNIVAELFRSGYSESDVEKVCWRNWFRVIKETI